MSIFFNFHNILIWYWSSTGVKFGRIPSTRQIGRLPNMWSTLFLIINKLNVLHEFNKDGLKYVNKEFLIRERIFNYITDIFNFQVNWKNVVKKTIKKYSWVLMI